MMVNIQIIMYQTTLYDIFFIDMIKRHKKGYNLQLSNSFVLSTLESYKLVGAYFHGLAIIQDSMECNLGISLMAIMKMIMFHYSYICNIVMTNLWVRRVYLSCLWNPQKLIPAPCTNLNHSYSIYIYRIKTFK